jgi:tetratricopeptide (TPR) repeat protein
MSSRRTVILMGLLLLLLAGYFSLRLFPPELTSFPHPPRLSALANRDSISGLRVRQTPSGAWIADFDYFYSGEPPDARLAVELTPAAGSQFSGLTLFDTFLRKPEPGAHHLSAKIQYPGIEGRTVRVTALMRSQMYGSGVATRQRVDEIIDWPDLRTYARNQRLATRSPEDNLKQAQALIDTGENAQIGEAKLMLEQLLEQNPNLAPAYVELARITLDTTAGPEGLHQAEELIGTALQMSPDNADAKILLANIYSHQGHFAKAEALFKEAAATHSSNRWLWENWGELLQMEHQTEKAAVMYRKVIALPMTHDRNDRARLAAYEQLLALLQGRKDFDGMEALYKQRIAEYGWGSCYSAGYTRFLLQTRGNIDGAIDSARRALHQNCDDTPSRELLGLAEYAKWADSKGPPRIEAISQARIFLPMSARALYLLATSARTAPAERQLVAAGEPIDQKDNDNFDALAYALQDRDFDAVRRLVALGARPETLIGLAAVPVALMPVFSGDAAGVRVLRGLGVNYSKVRYRGATALDIAKQQGNEGMLSALGGDNTTL